VNLVQVTRDEALQSVGLGDQTTEFLLVGRGDIRLGRRRVAKRVPVAGGERFFDTGK
jgi:hypothetical protein